MKAVRGFFYRLLLSGAVVLAVSSAQAKPFKILHSFAGGSDGANPYTPPVLADNGILYGTTNGGGPTEAGTIYQLAPDGTETVLHTFVDDPDGDGNTPNSTPAIDPSTGALYGTTIYGGNGGCQGQGCGVLWKLTRKGHFSVLHAFDGINDGGYPTGQLTEDSSGNFYGITPTWGANLDGTVFQYGANGTFTVLHTFKDKDGAGPQGRLTRDDAGNLYGTTVRGGVHSGGTVYRLAPDGTYTVLHAFAGRAEGGHPSGGLARDKAGNLYGTTWGGSKGAGTAFRLAPDGTLTTLYAFTGKADGGYPGGDLLKVGKYLYGTTEIGGEKPCWCGLVYKMALDGTETVLHAFTGGTKDGGTPFAGVTKGKTGLLYGATFAGGVSNKGAVFRMRI